MFAGRLSPEDAVAAVKETRGNERLDSSGFVERTARLSPPARLAIS
jgi:hypothetical protein